MRLHILYHFTDGPWGGGNQFLKALRAQWRRMDVYAEEPDAADVLLCNGHHRLTAGMHWRRKRPELLILHRLDGVLATQRAHGVRQDGAVHAFHGLVADATVFQSTWARDAHIGAGFQLVKPATVIPNAVDPELFHAATQPEAPPRPLHLVATSWSRNPRKGFALYEWLDRQLDPERYRFTFIGNAPPGFRCSRQLPPLTSDALARELRRHHVYISASEDDACSNALLEAMACGLPVLALRSGGHPELVGAQGLLFDGPHDVLPTLDALVGSWSHFRYEPARLDIVAVAEQYLKFAQYVERSRVSPPRPGILGELRLKWVLRQARLQ